MTKTEWKKVIVDASKRVDTYNKSFDSVIETLADILESRDKAMEQFKASGANPVITHTNKAGATNLAKNPLLVMAMDLNTQALAYWRDLGLTPAGLKKITVNQAAKEAAGGFEKLLDKLI